MMRFPWTCRRDRTLRPDQCVKRASPDLRIQEPGCRDKLKKLHVAVVGGGFAGLMAARRLLQQGVKVSVFEARKEVGGRVLSNPDFSKGRITEEGAELIGSFHTRWLELAREFGLAMISRMEPDLYEKECLEVRLKLEEKKFISPKNFKKLTGEMQKILEGISDFALKNINVDPALPWLDARLEKFDKMSVEQALKSEFGVTPDGDLWRMLQFKLENDEVARLKEMNFLGLLCKVRAGQGERRCVVAPDPKCILDGYWDELEIFRCADGCQTLATKLKKHIQDDFQKRGTVECDVAITRIALDSKKGVKLWRKSTRKNRPEQGAPEKEISDLFSYVVLAIPPSVWPDMKITVDGKGVDLADPAKGIGPMTMKQAVKHFSAFKKRFWIKKGLAPYGGSFKIGQVWEGTDNQTQIGDQEVVLSVFAGPISSGDAPKEADFQPELSDLYRDYKDNLIKRDWPVRNPLFSNWPAVPFIKTGYWSPKPGEIWRVGKKLNDPYHGRLFFAGEHTEMDSFGYMEGALRSGERAAQLLVQTACGLLDKPAPKPPIPKPPAPKESDPGRIARADRTRESAAFEREVAGPCRMRASRDSSEGESPFLGPDLLAGEVVADWEPRTVGLVAESPFVNAIEELGGGFDPGQFEEPEAVDELDDEQQVEAAEAWAESEGEELIPPADPVEDEALDENATDVESASLSEDEAEFGSHEDLVASESDLERFSDSGADELKLGRECECEHSELEDDFEPDLEEEKASLAPLGRPDFWPDVVYIVKGKDNFLNPAREFHTSWGLVPVEFDSFESLIGLIAKAGSPVKRLRVISHADDGFIVPLFSGSPVGFSVTQKQIEALNAGDGALMDELLQTLVDLDRSTDRGIVAWNALLSHIETSSPRALTPFGLTSKTKPSGDAGLLLRRCADLIALASANPVVKSVFEKAVRKSIAGAQDRLKRTKSEVKALEDSVTGSGFTFTMSPPSEATVANLRAAIDALDKRSFRATLQAARAKLKGKWLDFRGCRIGQTPKYLEALAILTGTDGCTAPDWWSGYPGEAPVHAQQVSSADAFKRLVDSSSAVKAAMNRWGGREVTGWSSVAEADKPGRLFAEFLVARSGVLPVYEVDYSGGAPKEKHTLYWNSDKGKERWLGSMWDRAPKKQVQLIARAWGAKTPRMAALALHLKVRTSTQASPQRIFAAPEPEFRDHIIEGKKP